MQRFEGQVQLVIYPFALNPTSEVATQAAWCAGEQGKFWEFHHMLYRRQELWNRLATPLERLSDFAKDLNVDPLASEANRGAQPCNTRARYSNRGQNRSDFHDSKRRIRFYGLLEYCVQFYLYAHRCRNPA